VLLLSPRIVTSSRMTTHARVCHKHIFTHTRARDMHLLHFCSLIAQLSHRRCTLADYGTVEEADEVLEVLLLEMEPSEPDSPELGWGDSRGRADDASSPRRHGASGPGMGLELELAPRRRGDCADRGAGGGGAVGYPGADAGDMGMGMGMGQWDAAPAGGGSNAAALFDYSTLPPPSPVVESGSCNWDGGGGTSSISTGLRFDRGEDKDEEAAVGTAGDDEREDAEDAEDLGQIEDHDDDYDETLPV
jgi:hypothetical protein